MTDDGLSYLPEGFREGARRNSATADAAEGTRRYLGNVPINAAAYAGAGAFPAALTDTRDTQARGVGQAAEGRTNMARADGYVATTGEEMDAGAGQALGSVTVPTADRAVADGV